jgi:hypothetical protein
MNFCHQCGNDLRKYTNPKFCIECGTSLNGDHTGPPVFVQEQPESKHDEWEDIFNREIDVVQAVSEFMLRASGAPTKIGVLIRMHRDLEASVPWHQKSLDSQMNQENPPFNLTVKAGDEGGEPELWRDSVGRVVPRAAAIAYHWGGDGAPAEWRIGSHLDDKWEGNYRNALESRLVTVEHDHIDFCIHFEPMDRDELRANLKESLLALEGFLLDGVGSGKAQIAGVGRIKSISIFNVGKEEA